jgi:molybdenum cofactor cytidylyltransferase
MTDAGKTPQITSSTEPKTAIVLLAAGEGSRMGSIPKALLKKAGDTLLNHFCRAAKALNPEEVLVLTGFHAQDIEAELTKVNDTLGLPITLIHNPRAADGQASSVRLALENLKSAFDVLIVALSDQPNVSENELKALLEHFTKREPHREIVLPQVRGQRGNPVLFSSKAVKDILQIPGMVCRPYMDQHPELLQIFETSNEAYVLDVDTLEDIQKLGIDRP